METTLRIHTWIRSKYNNRGKHFLILAQGIKRAICQTQDNHHQQGKQQKIYLPRCCQGNVINDHVSSWTRQPALNELTNQVLSFLECQRTFYREQFQKKVWTSLQSWILCCVTSHRRYLQVKKLRKEAHLVKTLLI